MNAFLKFRADRAFHEGMQAYREGHPNHAPARYCEHASDWVRGWNAAWLVATTAPTQPLREQIERVQSDSA